MGLVGPGDVFRDTGSKMYSYIYKLYFLVASSSNPGFIIVANVTVQGRCNVRFYYFNLVGTNFSTQYSLGENIFVHPYLSLKTLIMTQ
jgi:hypothetical protein